MAAIKPGRRLLTLLVIGLVVIGAGLRLAYFDLIKLGIDGVTAILTTQFWLTHGVPFYGQMSGAGIMMPPGFIFLLYPFLLVTASPLWVCCYIACFNIAGLGLIYRLGLEIGSARAGFWACGLMATHPWLILYSRQIWPQCMLPFFVIAFLIVIVRCTRIDRSRKIFWAGPLLSLIWQIHYSASGLLVFFIIWFSTLALQKRLRWSSALAGFFWGLALFLPHLYFLIQSDFYSLRQACAGRLGESASLGQNLFLLLKTFAETSFAGGFGFVFQSSQFQTMPLSRTALGAQKPWLEPLAAGSTLLVMLFFLLGICSREGMDRGTARLTRRPAFWLAFLALLPVFLYLARGSKVPPWYFIVALPAGVMLSGLGLARMADLGRKKIGGGLIPTLLGGGVLLAGGIIWLTFLAYINLSGGTGGLYGLTYRVQNAAAGRLIEEGILLERIEVRPDPAQGFGIFYLYHLRQSRPARQFIPSDKKARLIDSLLFPGETCHPGEEKITSAELGPLTICLSRGD
jgi:hypothetical protein